MTKPQTKDHGGADRWRMALLGIGGTVAAFFLFGGFGGLGRSGTSDPFDALPRASFLVATADFAELRRSPVYDVLLGKDAAGGNADPLRRALGVGALAEACGFDPLSRVQRFGVAVPEEGDDGEFGVAARVDVTRDEVERCTRSLASQRGEKAETHDVGTFVVLEDASSASSATRPRLAYGRGGLLVASKGAWFDAMLAAADHHGPGVRDSAEHMALRTSLTSKDGFHAPTLLATAILPRALRERLKGEMGAEMGAQDASSAIMAGVLGVSSVGLAVHAGGPGQNVDASVELVCDTPEACEAVEKLAQKKRREWSGDLAYRMIGFGPLFDSFEIKREGTRLRATVGANADGLAQTIERVLRLRARRPGVAAPPPPNDRAPARRPDETLPAKPDTTPPAGSAPH